MISGNPPRSSIEDPSEYFVRKAEFAVEVPRMARR